jgi:hypothetical protein
MSIQTYLYNIREKMGKTPEDFKRLAVEQGLPPQPMMFAMEEPLDDHHHYRL